MDGLMRERARTLRREMTEAERCLWYQLRAHRCMGLKFKRQKPLGRYIVDFVCLEIGLVIELEVVSMLSRRPMTSSVMAG